MKAKVVVMLALLSLTMPSWLLAQPDTWRAGPLLNVPGGANGPIMASILWDRDGDGFDPPWLVVAGNFTSIEGVPANSIAARNPSTGQWQALGTGVDPGANGGVQCLMVYNGDLIAGGRFGGPGLNIARWGGTSWQPMGAGFGATVLCLSVYNGDLIAGGYLSLSDGAPINCVARWTGSSWSQLGAGTNFVVWSLGFYNGQLIAGGDCNSPGNGSEYQPGIAAWNGSVWTTLGGGMGPMGNRVTSLSLYNGELIAGGNFSEAGGVAANKIARWNGSTWQSMGTIATGDHDLVVAFANQAGILYAAVQVFVDLGVWDGYLTRWNGSTWASVGSADDIIDCLTVLNGEVVVGGHFNVAGGQAAGRLARWTGSLWGPFGGGTVSEVNALAVYRNRIVAGGFFQQSLPGQTAFNIVRWNGLSLSTIGSGVTGPVYALKSLDTASPYELIAAGAFLQAGGISANRIARWFERDIAFPAPAWEAMGAGFNGTVYAIERYNGQTYAAGAFTASSGTLVNRIARWNEATDVWEPLGSGANSIVYALKSYGGYLYAGGLFTTAGGVTTGGLARWNGSAWSAVDGNFAGTVYALEIHNGLLEVGGAFTWFAGSPNVLTYFSGIGFSGFGGTNGTVRTLASISGQLFVGGDFTTVGGSVPASRIAYYDSGWHPAAGGTSGSVRTLGGFHGEVNAGGNFATVDGGLTSMGWARYLETGAPWLASQPASRSVTSGSDVTFTSQPAMGYGGAALQWYRFDQPLANGPTGHSFAAGGLGTEAASVTGSVISGANEATLTITNASVEDVGDYHLVVSNAYGGATSTTARLTVDGFADAPSPLPPTGHVFEALGPNPTSGLTRITFSLMREGEVRTTVHDVAGRRVRILDAGRLPAGRHQVSWDGRGSEGSELHAGLFFVTVEVDGQRLGTRRVVVQH